jgi:hypothetical protein
MPTKLTALESYFILTSRSGLEFQFRVVVE